MVKRRHGKSGVSDVLGTSAPLPASLRVLKITGGSTLEIGDVRQLESMIRSVRVLWETVDGNELTRAASYAVPRSPIALISFTLLVA